MWHSLYDRLQCASKAQAQCRPTGVKIYFPTYTFSIILGLKEENFHIPTSLSARKHSRKKIKTCSMIAELAFVFG